MQKRGMMVQGLVDVSFSHLTEAWARAAVGSRQRAGRRAWPQRRGAAPHASTDVV
jgi:hypothetical protein